MIDAIYDFRVRVILALVGDPDEWSDLTAIALCPVEWLPRALRNGRYAAAQGRHATNLIEGMGEAVRRMYRA